MPAPSIEAQTALGNASVNLDIETLQSTLGGAPDASASPQKISDVQSQTRVLKRHLDRLFDLEEVDDYLQFVVTVHPQLSEQVATLKAEHNEFRGIINVLIARLNRLEADDQRRFAAICLEIHEVTCRVLAHGRAEGKLLSRALNRDEGSEG
jgi:hemerythrin-like domain-containing protein